MALAAAGCSSSSSSSAKPTPSPTSTSGTESLTAVDTGSAAADNLNSNSNAPLTFPEGVWAGPVNVTIKPFKLPGSNGNGAATVTFVTPDGNLMLHHSANQVPGASNPNQPPPATWVRHGTQCYFSTTFSKGTFTFLSGTGKFAGAHSPAPGTYLVTAQGYAPLKGSSTTCSFSTTGSVEKDGAEIKFLATGPITVRT